MKRIMIIAAMLAMLALPTKAQVTNTGSFFNTALNYFTSFNTNLDSTFGAAKGQFWAGVDSIQGAKVNLANNLGISYKLFGPIEVENVLRNSGVAGVIVSDQIGFSLGFVVHDAKLSVYGHAGYLLDANGDVNLKWNDRIYGEIGLRIQKALTAHTYAGVGIGAEIPKNTQVFSAFAGITF